MISNFDKLDRIKQLACLSAGYNPLYGDYDKVAWAKQAIIDLHANSRLIDIVGAVQAVKNTCIIACARQASK